eukprot:scaffold97231_cov24-Tisochrysis_lutea.AAC.1
MQEYNISPFSIFAAVACTLPPLLHPPTDDLIPCRVDVRKDNNCQCGYESIVCTICAAFRATPRYAVERTKKKQVKQASGIAEHCYAHMPSRVPV